jgi:AdoMet-dependent heme synthase
MSGERTFDYEKAFNHGPLGCGGGSCRSCRTCDYDCKGNRTGLGDEEGVDEEIFYLQWHLTALCTNRCAHCYHEDYGTGGLAEDQLFAIADHFDEALDAWGRTGKVALTGGEPLIIKETTLAVSERLLAGHTDRIDILTNGTLVTHEVLDQLGALGPGARHIQLSIDGTQQTHDAIRGEGDFARVMRAAELVKLAGFSLSFMFTLSDHNAADLIAVHKIVESFGATIGIDRYAPLGQATNRDISTVSSEVVRTPCSR